MADRILFVDDEQSLLNGIERRLGGDFEMTTACSGAKALSKIEESEPFSVIVTDMRMPQMNGVQFIQEARKKAPDSVYIMLTGNQDQTTATEALNDGRVFRFLNKPCSSEDIRKALKAGIRQYQLITGEKELLHKTFVGAIGVLTDVLEIAHPEVFSQSPCIEQIVQELLSRLEIEERWEYKLAARLGLLGFALLPEQSRIDFERATPYDPGVQQTLNSAASIAGSLIRRIPRLHVVAKIIGNHGDTDGHFHLHPSCEEEIAMLGATLLRVAIQWNNMHRQGMSADAALTELKKDLPNLPQSLTEALLEIDFEGEDQPAVELKISELREGMVLHDDVITQDGAVLLRRGRRLTWTIIEKIRLHEKAKGQLKSIRIVAANQNLDAEPVCAHS